MSAGLISSNGIAIASNCPNSTVKPTTDKKIISFSREKLNDIITIRRSNSLVSKQQISQIVDPEIEDDDADGTEEQNQQNDNSSYYNNELDFLEQPTRIQRFEEASGRLFNQIITRIRNTENKHLINKPNSTSARGSTSLAPTEAPSPCQSMDPRRMSLRGATNKRYLGARFSTHGASFTSASTNDSNGIISSSKLTSTNDNSNSSLHKTRKSHEFPVNNLIDHLVASVKKSLSQFNHNNNTYGNVNGGVLSSHSNKGTSGNSPAKFVKVVRQQFAINSELGGPRSRANSCNQSTMNSRQTTSIAGARATANRQQANQSGTRKLMMLAQVRCQSQARIKATRNQLNMNAWLEAGSRKASQLFILVNLLFFIGAALGAPILHLGNTADINPIKFLKLTEEDIKQLAIPSSSSTTNDYTDDDLMRQLVNDGIEITAEDSGDRQLNPVFELLLDDGSDDDQGATPRFRRRLNRDRALEPAPWFREQPMRRNSEPPIEGVETSAAKNIINLLQENEPRDIDIPVEDNQYLYYHGSPDNDMLVADQSEATENLQVPQQGSQSPSKSREERDLKVDELYTEIVGHLLSELIESHSLIGNSGNSQPERETKPELNSFVVDETQQTDEVAGGLDTSGTDFVVASSVPPIIHPSQISQLNTENLVGSSLEQSLKAKQLGGLNSGSILSSSGEPDVSTIIFSTPKIMMGPTDGKSAPLMMAQLVNEPAIAIPNGVADLYQGGITNLATNAAAVTDLGGSTFHVLEDVDRDSGAPNLILEKQQPDINSSNDNNKPMGAIPISLMMAQKRENPNMLLDNEEQSQLPMFRPSTSRNILNAHEKLLAARLLLGNQGIILPSRNEINNFGVPILKLPQGPIVEIDPGRYAALETANIPLGSNGIYRTQGGQLVPAYNMLALGDSLGTNQPNADRILPAAARTNILDQHQFEPPSRRPLVTYRPMQVAAPQLNPAWKEAINSKQEYNIAELFLGNQNPEQDNLGAASLLGEQLGSGLTSFKNDDNQLDPAFDFLDTSRLDLDSTAHSLNQKLALVAYMSRLDDARAKIRNRILRVNGQVADPGSLQEFARMPTSPKSKVVSYNFQDNVSLYLVIIFGFIVFAFTFAYLRYLSQTGRRCLGSTKGGPENREERSHSSRLARFWPSKEGASSYSALFGRADSECNDPEIGGTVSGGPSSDLKSGNAASLGSRRPSETLTTISADTNTNNNNDSKSLGTRIGDERNRCMSLAAKLSSLLQSHSAWASFKTSNKMSYDENDNGTKEASELDVDSRKESKKIASHKDDDSTLASEGATKKSLDFDKQPEEEYDGEMSSRDSSHFRSSRSYIKSLVEALGKARYQIPNNRLFVGNANQKSACGEGLDGEDADDDDEEGGPLLGTIKASPKSKSKGADHVLDHHNSGSQNQTTNLLAQMDISAAHLILSYMEQHLEDKERLRREWYELNQSSFSRGSLSNNETTTATGNNKAGCSNINKLNGRLAIESMARVALSKDNKAKNRDLRVVAFDKNRVKLGSGGLATRIHGETNQPATMSKSIDYINATYIYDDNPRRATHIIAQGPLESTVAQFWQMIWEQGISVIVMLTQLNENNVNMCHCYWPTSEKEATSGSSFSSGSSGGQSPTSTDAGSSKLMSDPRRGSLTSVYSGGRNGQAAIVANGNVLTNIIQFEVSISSTSSARNDPQGSCSTTTNSSSTTTTTINKFEVHLVSEHVTSKDHLVRNMYMINRTTGETRTITQFHYLSWPDAGVPDDVKGFLNFRRKVNKSYRDPNSPILVHCSDGAGRSGTYILIDIILERIKMGTKEIDPRATLEHLRDQRVGLCATQKQFEFVMVALAEEIQLIIDSLPK